MMRDERAATPPSPDAEEADRKRPWPSSMFTSWKGAVRGDPPPRRDGARRGRGAQLHAGRHHDPLPSGPSLLSVIKSLLADEAIYRPTYTGTGVVTSNPRWGLPYPRAAGRKLDLERAPTGPRRQRRRQLPPEASCRARGGRRPCTSGRGERARKVVLTRRADRGNLGERPVHGRRRRSVIARSAEVRFRMKRPTRNLLGRLTAGESWWCSLPRPGRILLNPGPTALLVLADNRWQLDRRSRATF